ncbi:MAG TPA: hypothetical protein VFO16_21010 [Pseudonocardiaceae bacterium]|nr:hypothetical protein [Pseudonocardiaceae bacterium]
MSELISHAGIDEQRIELLPARTVLSLARTDGGLFGPAGGGGSYGGSGDSHSLLNIGQVLGKVLGK